MAISLVLADDHPIILAGLENMFRRERDLRVVASCADGMGAVRAITRYQPDIAILDIHMPRMGGLDVLRQLHGDSRRTRLVLLAATIDDDELLSAMRLGVNGVVLKEMAPQLLVQCVRQVHAGRQYVEKRALEMYAQQETATRDVGRVLTVRELEVARAVASGLRNKEIAERLRIAEGTVKIHLHTIYEKLHLDGRLALALRLKQTALA